MSRRGSKRSPAHTKRFNKQHGRFRAEIKDASVTLHDWHEDAVHSEAELFHKWTVQFTSDLKHLGNQLNELIAKAGHEVMRRSRARRKIAQATDAI